MTCGFTASLRRSGDQGAVSGDAGRFVPAPLEFARDALEMTAHRLARAVRVVRRERSDDRFVVGKRLRPERRGVEMNFDSRPEVATPKIPEARDRVENAITEAGAEVLHTTIDRQGVQVVSR